MPSRRDQIALSADEIADYLDRSRTVIAGTNGPRGVPHLMPLWFVMRGEEVWAWTFAKSQKARNLERDPRATLLVEDGDTYDQLRGVMIEAQAELVRSLESVTELGREIFRRYLDLPDELPEEVEAMIAAQAPKRVGLRFVARRYVSWDHRKLGGGY
jgi:PPOX class probable F420-dependent enzyme